MQRAHWDTLKVGALVEGRVTGMLRGGLEVDLQGSGIEADYIGYINYDDHVWRSVKDRRPLVLAYPRSDGALYIRRIAKKLLGG